jgi:hypothetical protein
MTAGANLATTGQVSSTNVASAAADFKTLVDAANLTTVGGDPVLMGIASRDSGFTVLAQDVKIDSKVDTQRRRTDKIAANNSAIAVF